MNPNVPHMRISGINVNSEIIFNALRPQVELTNVLNDIELRGRMSQPRVFIERLSDWDVIVIQLRNFHVNYSERQ